MAFERPKMNLNKMSKIEYRSNNKSAYWISYCIDIIYCSVDVESRAVWKFPMVKLFADCACVSEFESKVSKNLRGITEHGLTHTEIQYYEILRKYNTSSKWNSRILFVSNTNHQQRCWCCIIDAACFRNRHFRWKNILPEMKCTFN